MFNASVIHSNTWNRGDLRHIFLAYPENTANLNSIIINRLFLCEHTDTDLFIHSWVRMNRYRVTWGGWTWCINTARKRISTLNEQDKTRGKTFLIYSLQQDWDICQMHDSVRWRRYQNWLNNLVHLKNLFADYNKEFILWNITCSQRKIHLWLFFIVQFYCRFAYQTISTWVTHVSNISFKYTDIFVFVALKDI